MCPGPFSRRMGSYWAPNSAAAVLGEVGMQVKRHRRPNQVGCLQRCCGCMLRRLRLEGRVFVALPSTGITPACPKGMGHILWLCS